MGLGTDVPRGLLVTTVLCLCGLGWITGATMVRREEKRRKRTAAPGGTAAPGAGDTGGVFWLFLIIGIAGLLCGAWAAVDTVL